MMTELQQDFFSRLCAAWPQAQVKQRTQAGRTFSYITARMLFNRLDDVAGPANWFPEYKLDGAGHGVTCRLHILVPNDADERVWAYKEDGGGFAGMASGEDDQKSGYSDAIKRAGVAWGIGRYLYREGVPDYLGDQPPPPEPARAGAPAPRSQQYAREGAYDDSRGAPAQRPAQRQPAAQPAGRSAAPSRNPAPSRSNAPPRSNDGGYDNMKPPVNPGKAAFAWLKNLEAQFGSGILKIADEIAKENGYPFKTVEWNAEELEHVAWTVIDTIKGWDTYDGEFDHLEDPRPEM